SSGWDELGTIWPYFAAGFICAALLIRPLDRLALGDDVAASLGSPPHLIRPPPALAPAPLAAPPAAVARPPRLLRPRLPPPSAPAPRPWCGWPAAPPATPSSSPPPPSVAPPCWRPGTPSPAPCGRRSRCRSVRSWSCSACPSSSGCCGGWSDGGADGRFDEGP